MGRMSRAIQVIEDKTPLSIKIVIPIILAVVWLVRLEAKAERGTEAANKAEAEVRGYRKELNEINTRLSRIEGAVGAGPRIAPGN